MRNAIVITHVAFEDLGTFAPVLTARGYTVEVIDAATGDLATIQRRDPDLLVVLGGPISVNDRGIFPFLETEIQVLADRLARDRPCIGVCLGAQLMATALGASVTPMAAKEIGFGPLSLTAEGRHSALGLLPEDATVLHWHGEQFSVPPRATLLASSPLCAAQAFAWKNHGLGLQFHLEADGESLERWYVGHIVELMAAGVDVLRLRSQAKAHAGALRESAQRVLARWLDERGL